MTTLERGRKGRVELAKKGCIVCGIRAYFSEFAEKGNLWKLSVEGEIQTGGRRKNAVRQSGVPAKAKEEGND